MSTTTELLLLAQKVDLLESHMNWVIGGVTLTITALMAIFAVIQFVYQRKSAEGEIKKAESELVKMIDEKLLEKELILKTRIDKRIEDVSNNLRREIASANTDIARNFAISAEKDNLHSAAFNWWLSAAVGYAGLGQDSLRSMSIKNAKEQLEKVKDRISVNFLLEDSTNIISKLHRLHQKHPIEAEILEGIFRSKLVLTSSQSTQTSVPSKT